MLLCRPYDWSCNPDLVLSPTIFSMEGKYLRDKEIEINNIEFCGNDGSATMAGEYNGVKSFESSTSYFHYIHCQNLCLALYFAHLICWLSHGKAAEWVLDCCESLVAALNAIYVRKYKPAVWSVQD